MARLNTEHLQVSVSPDLYGWLREQAHEARSSISAVAREILAEKYGQRDPAPEPHPVIVQATRVRRESERLRGRVGEAWSAVCPERQHHKINIRCLTCGGSKPR